MLNENSYFIFILKIVNKKHTHTHTQKKAHTKINQKKRLCDHSLSVRIGIQNRTCTASAGFYTFRTFICIS